MLYDPESYLYDDKKLIVVIYTNTNQNLITSNVHWQQQL